MKFSLPLLALFALFFASCRPDPPAPASFVYSDGYNITLAESWEGKLLFQIKSNKDLNCKNYRIGYTCTNDGTKVTMVVAGVNAPATCESGNGPALDTAALSLAVGTYPLEITNNESQIVGTLAVTATKYTVTYAGGNGITFATTTLNRVPANTLRGTIQYIDANYKKIADTFVDDSLKYLGATNFSGPLVSYSDFTVYTGNTFTSGLDPLRTMGFRNFIFDFSGTVTDLTKMVNRYKKHGDNIKISITTNGQHISTHGTW